MRDAQGELRRRNDVRRKPEQMLCFIGTHPRIVAVDLSQGGTRLQMKLSLP